MSLTGLPICTTVEFIFMERRRNCGNRQISSSRIFSLDVRKVGAIDPIGRGGSVNRRYLANFSLRSTITKMNRHERGLEFKVGIFVFAGLAMLGALVVQFGRLGEGFKTYYPLTIRFSDASGLLKGTDVLLAGARIGKVAGGPKLLREGDGVAVPLKIYDYIKIPEGTKFTVGSSGLLGDRFVNVIIPSGQPKGYLPPNAFVNGT